LARRESESVAAVDETSPAKNPATASPRVGPSARTAMYPAKPTPAISTNKSHSFDGFAIPQGSIG
jgi:hypothetical protein